MASEKVRAAGDGRRLKGEPNEVSNTFYILSIFADILLTLRTYFTLMVSNIKYSLLSRYSIKI